MDSYVINWKIINNEGKNCFRLEPCILNFRMYLSVDCRGFKSLKIGSYSIFLFFSFAFQINIPSFLIVPVCHKEASKPECTEFLSLFVSVSQCLSVCVSLRNGCYIKLC